MPYKDANDLPRLSGEYKLKDTDSAARAEFLKLFFWMFYPLGFLSFLIGGAIGAIGTLGFFIGGIIGILAGGLVSLVSSFVWMAFLDNAGGTGAGILSGNVLKGGDLTLREQLEAEFQKVKYYKRQKQFDQALKIVNGILEKDMVYAEALHLKAVILWDGFGDSTAAKECLMRIMEMKPVEDEMFRRFAASLYDELNRIDRR